MENLYQISDPLASVKIFYLKVKRKIFKSAVPFPLALLLSIFLILLRPIILIRLGNLGAGRLAHFALGMEEYLCEKDAGLRGEQKSVDFFFITDSISNTQLLKMWKRTCIVSLFFPNTLKCVTKILNILPSGTQHIISKWGDHTDEHNLIPQFSPHISFQPEEETTGKALLKEMGVTGEFICFHVRDAAYLNQEYPGRDWTYHDYRDADIDNYVDAVNQLSHRNLFSFRMGAIVEKPLSVENPKIIDYASHHRSDFLDIYLGSHCKFSINSTSGIYAIPKMFNRPMVVVNLESLRTYVYIGQNNIFIPKLNKSKTQNRLLTFRESSQLEILNVIKEGTISCLENSPEDITDAVLEMDDRLNGTWEETKEDQALQQAFWEIVESDKYKRPPGARIGAKFLRKYQDLCCE